MNVTVVDKDSDICGVFQCLRSESILALDCEGVDLGRTGEICIVQLSTRERCFLFDVHRLTSNCCEMIDELKDILENNSIMKIIHDCKMDSDALYHLLGIRLHNVHDTQAWDQAIRGKEVNLNDLLSTYALPQNNKRDKNMYVSNFRFWATRPLTSKMIDWASGDVGCLFQLHERQNSLASPSQRETGKALSNANLRAVREGRVTVEPLNGRLVGRFIGPKGRNLKSLSNKVPGCFFQFTTIGRGGISNRVVAYAPDERKLNEVRRLLTPYLDRR
mmetsp:Transcript_24690/g.36395  ORF Transcript_24690/g.36395 Transcript_24690/m.36395 type:complete len:275 (+) Transcript_24690:501-1325(+)|eukprot:CAMPEP_0185041154 /NCGR_PEP_ID=MMETSP1103-20130426/40065_1 /TAXON_ID=36769 /ORGANISM="Paraphysomonas bandaiensis, Strain Caron Lab Isolate" /LENGTH=274 /DNA_ID=CAMNT_0027580761 /DNA_START=472 /DNA_END=1296 /DNA_ORIENTATION=+